MKMIKNRLFIAFLAFSLGNNLQSMEPEKSFSLFADLPPEVQKYVVQLMSISSTAKSVREAGKIINTLAQTNTKWNELINNPLFCFKIIKNLAQQFGCSDQEAAEALQTQEAKKRLDIQNQLYDICHKAEFNEEEFNIFYEEHKQYIDFSFMYYTLDNQDEDDQEEEYQDTIVTINLLMLAAKIGKCPLIRILLTHGVNINEADSNGNTPLMMAIDYENIDAVKCLLENADLKIDQQNNESLTALMLAVRVNNCVIIQELLKRGANINKVVNDQVTALMIAAGEGYREAVECLSQNSHIAINKKDRFGLTALMYAVVGSQNTCPIIQILLRYGADINAVDSDGMTALIIGIINDRTEEVECLLGFPHIAINHQDKNGNSALKRAILQRNTVKVKMLLDAGANPELVDKYNATLLDTAKDTGDQEIIHLIVDAIKKWSLREVLYENDQK